MSKHTPAPWSVQDPLGPEIFSIVALGDRPVYEWRHIAQLTMKREDATDPTEIEQKANAHLIAAAPELLATLKNLLDGHEALSEQLGFDHGGFTRVQAARAAIAKAEGRP